MQHLRNQEESGGFSTPTLTHNLHQPPPPPHPSHPLRLLFIDVAFSILRRNGQWGPIPPTSTVMAGGLGTRKAPWVPEGYLLQ